MSVTDKFTLNIRNMVSKLLDMARESSWNNISDNCLFILSEIVEVEGENTYERTTRRKELNDKKNPKPLGEVLGELKVMYPKLYDVNLYVYKAGKNATIVEIQYYLKTSLDRDYRESVRKKEPMLHCKVAIPPYARNIAEPKRPHEKFDINWEHGGLRHRWNMFKWRRKRKHN